jgi:subtilisin family serine protease
MFQRAVLIAACLPLLASAAAAAEVRHVYLLRLQGQSLVEHVHARVTAQDLAAVEGGEKPAMRRELRSSLAQDYLQQLDTARARVLDAGSAELGRTLTPHAVYRYAGNGMALSLTDAEAAQMATLPGVLGLRRERVSHPLTDAGPQWIGADKLWNGGVSGIAATKGEGVVIGIIDTGISPAHPSFAATGPDGYAIANPRGHFYGLCASGQATCNNKLIGIYDFTDEGTKGIDSVGHGTHVAGIAAGDGMNNALAGTTVSLSRFVSGVAPHANIIMYKACNSSSSGGTCPESALVGALDQAIADNVDVINYSIGGDAQDAWQLLAQGNTDAAAMFNARAAGIVVVAAMGNEGPGPNSLGEPGNVPWVIGVANATHNRQFANTIGGFSGAPNAPATQTGAGYTSGYGPAEIVYAGNYGNALCGTGPTDYPPTGKSNPFPPGTFHGQIVICDRGIYARVEKGYNVKLSGAGGYILANAQSDGESIVSDDHYLPAVHLGYAEGEVLKDWVASSGSHQGRISGVTALLDASLGDILNASSSRGPYGGFNKTLSGGILKPDITAPGTNILSSDYQSNGLVFMSGTSMASPHVAGAAALLVAAHPTWGPAQIESALVGTALAGSVRLQDGVTPATPLDAGAGRVQLAAAVQAGLYLPLSAADFRAQDPSRGGNPTRLNRPGIESESCPGQCSFVRNVADMSGGGAWTASVQGATANAKITVTPTQFTLAAGASQTLNIAVDVSDPHLIGTWANARIVLHKTGGGQAATDTALTLAVYSSPGSAPAFQQLSANGPTTNVMLNPVGLVALPQATFGTTSLWPAQVTQMNLGVDPKPGDLYATFPGTGKQFVLFPITWDFTDFFGGIPPPAQARALIVEITASTASSAILYAGVDYNGDGQPEFAEQTCSAPVSAGSARCVVDLGGVAKQTATNAWALVDIPQGTTGTTYSVTVSGGTPYVGVPPVPPGADFSFGQLIVTGPGHVPAGASIPLRLTAGTVVAPVAPGRYYGAVTIDAIPGVSNIGQVGIVPFSLTRASGNDDVADALEPNATRTLSLAPGETLAHQFIDVAGQSTLLVNTRYVDGSPNTAPVNFRVTRADFPPPSASPQIAGAPGAGSGDAQWSLGGTTTVKSVTVPVNAGRWYVVASNAGSTSADIYLTAQTNLIQQVTPPRVGAFYNPQRSGHGTFMNQAGGQQALYWYTYLEDGTPVWYIAQAAAPASGSGTWTAPLGRVSWNGAAVGQVKIVGNVILTPLDANNYIFSWHLYGQSGSEHFVLLGADQCVSFNGGQADFTGQWYAPTQSGYGMDVLAIPDNPAGASFQFDAFYFYDALGQPRWAAGTSSPFGPQSAVTMSQISGFCPLCAAVKTTTKPIGTLNVNFSNGTQGSYSTSLNLLSPLSGSWNINQPIVRLTGSAACPN